MPFDFSAPAFEAVEVGHSLDADASRLHLLHVMAEHVPVAVEGVWIPPTDENEMKQVKESLRKQADKQGFQDVGGELRFAQQLGACLAFEVSLRSIDPALYFRLAERLDEFFAGEVHAKGFHTEK